MLTEPTETPEKLAERVRRRAYHEAGHAVLAHRFGIPVHEVSIVPDEESAGHVHAGRLVSDRAERELDSGNVSLATREEIEQRCISFLGGEEAQFRVDTEGGEDWRRARAQSENGMDEDDLTRLLMRLHRDMQVVAQRRAELHARTAELLGAPEIWGAVESVANALREQLILTGDEVTAIILRSTTQSEHDA